MTKISRVILDEKAAIDERLSLKGSFTFSINNRNYVRFEDPSHTHIEAARRFINAGLSAGIIPDEARHPDAIFFDMDGTVIEEESLVEIAKSTKKEAEIERLTTLAMNGDMDFKTSLQARLNILKGLTRSQVLSIRPTLCQGIEELSLWCRLQKIKLFLISGGFVELAGPVAQQIGFEDFRANKFAWDGDVMQGKTDGDIIDADGKKAAVLTWIKTHGLRRSHTIAVGDGANDLPMMKECGLAAGFRPKPKLWTALHLANHTGDHRFLLEALR